MICKGDVVQCPHCGLDLYEVTKDIRAGEPKTPEYFRGIFLVPSPKRGDTMRCMACHSYWIDFLGNTIHVAEKGWVDL